MAAPTACQRETIGHHSFDGASGEDANGQGDVARWHDLAMAEEHVSVDVEAFGVLPQDDQVGVLRHGGHTCQRQCWADIGVELVVLSQFAAGHRAPRLVPIGGIGSTVVRTHDPAVSERQRLLRGGGHRIAAFADRLPADRQGLPIDRHTRLRRRGIGQCDGGRHDLGPDAVAVEHGHLVSHVALLLLSRRSSTVNNLVDAECTASRIGM